MKFIHIADIHLGMTPDIGKVWSDARSKELYESFYKVLKMCQDNRIELLLIAGDLFHRQPLIRELKELNYQFSKLTDTKVVIIAGNHDYIGEHSRYRDFEWCEQVIFLEGNQLESVYISELKTTVYGFSYHKRVITEVKLDNVRPNKQAGYHILLAHGGDDKNLPMNKKYLVEAGFDYIALGHIHKPELLDDAMAYAGSLEPLDRNETGQHGYIEGEFNAHNTIDIKFIPFSKRQYYHLEMDIEPGMVKGSIYDRLQAKILELGQQHIYKLVLSGIRDQQLVFEESDFNKLGNIIEVEDKTIPDYDFERLQYENRDNIVGMYINAIRHNAVNDDIGDKALYYGMEALLKKNL